MPLCDYGCGQEAKYQFKNGKWCCSQYQMSCPATNPWNKNKTGVYTKETLKNISEKMKGKPGYWTGKKRYKETIEKIKKNHANVFGKNNPNWKGGYSNRNIPLYNNFFNKLTIEESPMRDTNDLKVLTVLCTQCKKRFIPKASAVEERIRALNGKQFGEQRLYCSNDCKMSCSIFGKHTISKNFIKEKPYTSEEYQTFRQQVLNRENYKCEYCGKKANTVHHIMPQKLEPIHVLDPDFGVACCQECHYKYGHKDECGTGVIASKICN